MLSVPFSKPGWVPKTFQWFGPRSLLPFYGFLRCSEFTYQGVHTFRPRFDLSAECVSFHPSLASPQHIIVTLKSSKTDSFHAGQSLLIARADTPVCVIAAMHHYFQSTSLCPSPLFSFRSGRLLTRSAVICLLRDAACHASLKGLKGHSFRIGTASTTAAAGLPDWLIKVLGRWSSDCYQLYIGHHNRFCCPQLQGCLAFFNNVLFFLQFVFFCFSFCLEGYPLREYLWRLSPHLRSDFPKLSY